MTHANAMGAKGHPWGTPQLGKVRGSMCNVPVKLNVPLRWPHLLKNGSDM